MSAWQGAQKKISLLTYSIFLTVILVACDGSSPAELGDCSTLTFKENVILDDDTEAQIYRELFDCYEDFDAGVKAFGGVAYDVGFTDDGKVNCVATYAEELVPRSQVEAVSTCQMNVLEATVVNECEGCGLRGYGFLLCLNSFGGNECDDFIEDTKATANR